jgi:hypothetical protein
LTEEREPSKVGEVKNLAIGIVTLAWLALASSGASAQGLAIAAITPANAAIIAPATQVTFVADSAETGTDPGLNSLFVEVATQPTLGQDGTLAEEYKVESVGLQRGDALPNRYTGASYPLFAWPRTPGTYYWMAYCFCLRGGGRPVTTPVYSFTIEAPLTMPIAEARAHLRPAIRAETGRLAWRLSESCSSRTATMVRCKVGWRTTASVGRSTVAYVGTLTIRAVDSATYSYEFSGKRAKASCVRKRGVRKCSRKVGWAETERRRG